MSLSPTRTLKERGVAVLPFLGPNGETVLVRIDHRHRQIGDLVYVPPGASHLAAADSAWDDVDRADPVYLRAI